MSGRPATPRKKIPLIRGNPRGVFHGLFDPGAAAELTMRANLLRGLQTWPGESGLTQSAASKELSVTQAISQIGHGEIGSFSPHLLVRLPKRAGMRPEL